MQKEGKVENTLPNGINQFTFWGELVFLCLKAQTIPSQKDLPFEKDPYIIRSILLLDSTLFLH